jgi:hypothetical protein
MRSLSFCLDATQMWCSSERELGKEPLDQVELDDTISSPSTTIPMVEVLRRRGSSMPVVSRWKVRGFPPVRSSSRSLRERGEAVPRDRGRDAPSQISGGFLADSNRSLDGSPSKFRILKNHRAETRSNFAAFGARRPNFLARERALGR